jgi:hypothetical protein
MSTSHTEHDWELEFIKTGDIEHVPEDDRERVLHELQELCELARLLTESSQS